jgi:hypothetical protein
MAISPFIIEANKYEPINPDPTKLVNAKPNTELIEEED